MSRTHTFRNKRAVVDSLNDLGNLSRFLVLQLADVGYVAIHSVRLGGRGRPQHLYSLTGKARGLLALAKNWGTMNHYLRQNLKVVSNVTAQFDYQEAA